MRLDDDLAAWADAVRLPAAEADAIFRRVIETPAAAAPVVAGAAPTGLAPSWWREFNAGLADRVIDSTRPAQSRAAQSWAAQSLAPQQRAARGRAARRQAPPWPPAQRRAA
jgi:hypothetical protein